MLSAALPELVEEELSPTRSRFVLEPLEPGFASTLANTIRRTLLSSIPGAALTAVRVDGALHEFTTIPGVKEDMVELVMNLKQVCVSSTEDSPQEVSLTVNGPGLVYASDFILPAGVEVHNPDFVIASLEEDAVLALTARVERGRGYVSQVQNKQVDAPIGEVALDALYSPVEKVSYEIENTRVEQRTDFNRLVLDVTVKPSITPREAIASAGETLANLIGLFRALDPTAEGIELPAPLPEEEVGVAPTPVDAPHTDLASLVLSARTSNSLRRAGYTTVASLAGLSYSDLLAIQGMGAKSADEVVSEIKKLGLNVPE